MKRTHLYRLLALVLALSLAVVMAGCSGGGDAPVIGINQYGEHASLDNCRLGFLQGLADAGLKEGTDFTVNYQNAGFSDDMAIQIAQNFAANDVALMCAVATNSATACFAAAEEKNIPVIFTAISDPAAAGLTEGNVTGTSDKLPVEAQLDLIRLVQPDAKTIGIVYTTSEPNSVSTVAEYQEKGPQYGFEIVTVGVTSQGEVTQAVDKLIHDGVDCFSNLTDNTVVGVLSSVLEKTNEAGIPVYGSEVEQVKIGCVASAGIDYFELGRRTGAMAASVLKGEATAEEIPYETISDYTIYVNSQALADMAQQNPDMLSELPNATEAADA